MNCWRCSTLLAANAQFCAHCGAAQTADAADQLALTSQRPTLPSPSPMPGGPSVGQIVGFGCVGLVALFAIVVVVGPNSGGNSSVIAQNTAAPDTPLERQSTVTPSAVPAAAPSATPSADPPSNWTYSSDQDSVRGGTSYHARVTSANSIAQDFPYDSNTTMDLQVRKSPAYGTDVILTVSSGQMMCPSYEGCSATVRFDDGPAQRVRLNGPADNSSETVFVVGAKAFIAKLKRSRHVVIEKTLYQAGAPQFEFNTAGLVWDH